ncbi:alpha-hydroxy-acid oxidizing protein [Achromobacter denitrificans]|uniref:alpha-hydroxy acid oxidase n=1 Tax=Achromobacter denitrificans TaxID=32002 RepID=UPI000F675355|nr:alpha-hydroxy acid oxidase [Achromobacter denitrificans]MDX3880677.1 alpha-hydroxy acid oxidase [Achromobacter sp.]MBV2160770.1 alpha-hydroxy-acid oxidizing protein [Achromobacter denitrificans]MDF3940509.1 alpha-hydroxy acid oxidase [Achromobacter denitrificans]RSE86443.1 alpha-hydroxy-acid oxidizing protein [Achromobacter denitrificans]WFC67223.1 alpha-hydroxy-acid oxidizing protein [Achromobacter denitrificans]
MNSKNLLSVADFERAAQSVLPRAVFGYVNGGTEDCLTLEANRSAFRSVQFRPRGLVGVADRTQAVELWGRRYHHPFGIAPMGVTAMCRHRCEWDLAKAASDAEIPFVLSGLSTLAMETVRKADADFWYQGYLPGDKEVIEPLMRRLRANGVNVLVVTIDTPLGANRENNQRNGFTIPFKFSRGLLWDGIRHPRWSANVFARTLLSDREIPRFCNVVADARGYRITEEPKGGLRGGRDRLDWSHLEWMREAWPGRIVLKGVAHPGDAQMAERMGLDGLIVSNHGGRQLDGAQGSLDALSDVVAAVASTFPVMIDGGFRRGTDILKAIALGARMVFMGRPFLYGASVAGQAGVTRIIDILGAEIDRNLGLLGCRDVTELGHDFIAPRVR